MNRLPHDLPIEDLSERSWSRLEDDVFHALDHANADPTTRVVIETESRRPLWRPLFGIAGFAAAAVVAAFVLLDGGTETPGTPAPSLSQRVATADDSSQITAGDASLDVAPQSVLVMSGDDERGVLVVLERGSVEFAVAPRRERPPYVVQAGGVRVEVVGTKFAVTRDGDSAVVEVMKGTVRVTADGETTMVTAGEAWISPAALEDIEEIEEEEIEEAEIATAAPARTQPRKRHRRIKRHERDVEPAPTPEVVPTAKELYNRAASLEVQDPDTAIAIYRDLARGSGTWASSALFARARLAHDRGRTQTATTLLRRYLKRFPGGPHAADARYLLGQAE